MARPLRLQLADAWYHVTARGLERREIFTREEHYVHFLELLSEWVPRFRLGLHAYVLMPNHVHLVVSTPEANLSAAMQWLKTSYSMWFNRRTRRVGPLFQGRYKAELLEGRAVAWAITQYVHLNPVRVQALGLGKVEKLRERRGSTVPAPVLVQQRLAVLRDYRWSSFVFYSGQQTAPPWLTVRAVLTGGRVAGLAQQQAAYRRAIAAVVGAGVTAPELAPAVGGLLRGGGPWVLAMRRRLQGDAREQSALHHLALRPDWAAVRGAVEQVKGEPWAQFAARHGDTGRDVALYVLRREGGLTLRAAGQLVGLPHYNAAAQAIRRLYARLPRDKHLRRFLSEVIKCIKV
jgi:REP element-mobilizing transposase RayT